ncbi:hypothetical protein A9Q91_03250 [Candidatus Gracilibacteria bacterium 28_42_T64]|nr:hypothetical protein A9Q91_03250 [Candidatus Gracilibacteria bacterium 28_42_T64]
MTILLTIIIFLEIIQYIVFADVILSWLTVFGLKLRPKFLAYIIDPLYENIKKIIPTTIGPIDFTPIVVILILAFVRGILFLLFPELKIEVIQLLN